MSPGVAACYFGRNPKSQVKPLGRKGNDNWGGMGVTLVDSLDTLWIMGLKAEFYKGRWVDMLIDGCIT